ncbi:MAG: SWEET family sugar transporter [archaeon]|nr:SWEET family sugar transporter [archaeon]
MSNQSLKPEDPSIFGVDLKTIFSVVGTVIGIILNLAPGVNFYNVWTKKKPLNTIVESVLLFNVICSLLWTAYWYPQDVLVPIFSSGAGTFLSLVWASLYMFLICKNNVEALMYSMTIYNSCVVLFYVMVKIGPNISGPIATTINILTYAAPAQNLLTVFKSGNCDLIPIPSVASGLACAFCWLIFGLLQHDWNCIIPNSLGCTFSTINLILWLFFFIKGGKKPEEKKEKLNEEGDTELQTVEGK